MTSEHNNLDFSALNPADQMLVGAVRRPVFGVLSAVFFVSATGWLFLIAMAATFTLHQGLTTLGPGMDLVEPVIYGLRNILDASPATAVQIFWQGLQDFHFAGIDWVVICVMWVMMSLAMMLPTAAPMLVTYAEIANTGRSQGDKVPSLFWLASGYLVVWIFFSIAATIAQWGLQELVLMSDAMRPVGGILAALILLFAGLYQFSALKDACLKKCQRPFATLFARWNDQPTGVFRLGIEQGLYCLGCCWALMCIMFVVGVMNLVWIAVLSFLMLMEKLSLSKKLSNLVGFGLIGWSFAVFASHVLALGA